LKAASTTTTFPRPFLFDGSRISLRNHSGAGTAPKAGCAHRRKMGDWLHTPVRRLAEAGAYKVTSSEMTDKMRHGYNENYGNENFRWARGQVPQNA